VPTYAVDIDRARMARLGLTLPDVSASLQAGFGSVQAGNLERFGREWPILLEIDAAGRGEVERLIRTNLRRFSRTLNLPISHPIFAADKPVFAGFFGV